nr:putative ribonuclease H-like domain-containing protein [Tanacetum cinerariifolium]
MSERRNHTLLDMSGEALVKWDTPDRLQQRSVKCIFIGYPKETVGYYFYFPLENKIVVVRYVEFFEKNLISQEVNGRARELKEIQDEDTSPSKITSKIPTEVKGFVLPQEEEAPFCRSVRTHRAPECLCPNVEVKEHSLMDLNETTNYKDAMLDPKSNKWLDAMNAKMQSMKDNQVWCLVDHPPNCNIVGSKWIFKKKTNMDGIIHTYKAYLVSKGYTQTYVVDYKETFSPVADIRAIRILIVITAQSAYMDKILKRFKMKNYKRGNIPMQERFDLNKTQGASTPEEVRRMKNVPYASAAGSIMYAVRCTRPDVAFAQNITSYFQQNSGEPHWTSMKTILKYLRNTKDMFLVYGRNPKAELQVDCYCDARFETDRDDINLRQDTKPVEAVSDIEGNATLDEKDKESKGDDGYYQEFVRIKKLCDDLRVTAAQIYPRRNSLEELFTQQEEMELETTQTNTTAKLPMLKQGEYEMWRLRIEQYFQVQDYALWDVIESDNSFVPVTQTITAKDGAITTTILSPVTAEEKIKKNNDVKARSMLLMALPNEHQITFNQYKDVKSLFAAIETSTNSTNDVYDAYGVSTASTQSSNASSQASTANLKEIGLKWQLALLSMKSYMAEDEAPTNIAVMAFFDSEFESYRPKSCEKESKNASEDIPNEPKEYLDAPLVKDRVLDNKDCSVESPVVVEKKTDVPIIAKVEVVRPKQQKKLVRKIVRPRSVNTDRPNSAVFSDVKANQVTVVKTSACWVWRPTKPNGHPQKQDQGYVDSGCSRHITGNISYLSDFKEFDGGYVTFGGEANGGGITEDVYFVKELKFNLLSVSQMTLIEAARTMLADSKLPITFWAEAVSTACYVQNRALVVKPHNKTPYELFRGRTPALSFIRPFGCHVIILNTLDHLGKFDGKADEGYFVGYYMNSKAFMVYNIRTRRVEENLHVRFLEDKLIITGVRPKWLFDIDMLIKSMNYVPVIVVQTLMILQKDGLPLFNSSSRISSDAEKKHDEVSDKECRASNELNSAFENLNTEYPDDPKMLGLETIATYDDSEEEADFTNLESLIHVSPTSTTRTHKNHPLNDVYEEKTHEDLNTCLFTCFLSQIEPTRVAKALSNPAWVFKKKKDDRGIMIKNKARLVVHGHIQEEGVDYDEVFAPVARIKAIRLFLIYASFMGLMVYQINVKSAFLYKRIKKEHFMVCIKLQEPDVKFSNTSVDIEKTLFKDADGADVDVHLYRSMIGSLMYLTASIPDIIDYPFELVAYTDSDYAGCKKQTVVATSTTEAEYMAAASCCGKVNQSRVIGFGEMIQYNLTTGLTAVINVVRIKRHSKQEECICKQKEIRDEATTKVNTVNGEKQIQALVDKKKVIIKETSVRSDLHLEDAEGTECLPTATIFEQLTLMGSKTTAWNKFSSTVASAIIYLATNQKINFSKYIFDHMVENLEDGVKFFMFPRFVQVFLDSQGKDFSGKIAHLFETMIVQPQEDMGEDSEIPLILITQPLLLNHLHLLNHNRNDHVTTTSNDPLLCGEDRLKLTELMELCTQLHLRVLALETKKVDQALEIEGLKRKGDQEDASKQERMIEDLDVDEGVALADETQGRNDQDMFDTSILDDEEVVTEEVDDEEVVVGAEKEVSTADSVSTVGEVVNTAGVETSKPKAKGIVIQEPSETPTQTPIDSPQKPSKAKGIRKAKMIEPKKPLKRKDEIMIDEEVAKNLEAQMQAELEEEERLARQKEEETNIALVVEWDNTQAMIDVDCELAARLQEEEREELTIEELSRLFVKLMDKRKKHFARLRAEKIRNVIQQYFKVDRSICSYGYRVGRSSKKTTEGSEKAQEDSSKRAADKLEQENAKRQRIEEENESAKLKRCLEIIPEDDDDLVAATAAMVEMVESCGDHDGGGTQLGWWHRVSRWRGWVAKIWPEVAGAVPENIREMCVC